MDLLKWVVKLRDLEAYRWDSITGRWRKCGQLSGFLHLPEARGEEKKNDKQEKKNHLFCLFLFFNGTQQLAVATFHFLPYT